MKYICLAYYDADATEKLPKEEMLAIVSECPPHDKVLRESGHLVMGASLGGRESAKSLRRRKDKFVVTDGPFTESKELVGGFFMIEASDADEAVRIASLHPAARIGESLGWGVEMWPVDFFEEYEHKAPS